MKILVTGGGGFLGQALCRRLIAEGHTVTSFSRSLYPSLKDMGVISLQGSVADFPALRQALRDQDACFHTASKVAMWGKWEDFYQTNTIGTQNVIQAMKDEGVPLLIYTSTPSVVFGTEDLINIDESMPYPQRSLSRYARSKRLAEEMVLAANGEDLQTVSLRPHLMFGPGDSNLLPRLIDAHRKKRLKQIGDGLNMVDVLYIENAVDAHVQALHKMITAPQSITGRAFFLGQGPVNLWAFINKIMEKNDLPPVHKKMNFKKAYALGSIIEGFLSLFGRYHVEPPMTRFVALQLAKNHYFDHSKSHHDLGWQPKIDVDEGLKRWQASL